MLVNRGEISDVGYQGDATIYAEGEPLANPDLTAVGFVLENEHQPMSPRDAGTAHNCYIWANARSKFAGLTNPAFGSSPNCRYFAVAADGRPIIEVTSGVEAAGQMLAVDPAGNGGIGNLGRGTTRL